MNAETRGVQVKLWDPLRTRAIPERLRGVIQVAIQIHVYLYLYLRDVCIIIIIIIDESDNEYWLLNDC